MIHSGVQYAQSWTSFNLSRIKNQLTKIALWDCQWCFDHELLWNFSRCGQIHWTCQVVGEYEYQRKKMRGFPPPKFFSCHSPIQKGILSAIKLQFHMADMRRQRKRKYVRNHQICLLYFSSWTVGLCYACHLVLAVKLWWPRFSGVIK